MTKTELQIILKEIGWTQVELCRRMEIHPSTASKWDKVPVPVAAYLELACQVRKLLE